MFPYLESIICQRPISFQFHTPSVVKITPHLLSTLRPISRQHHAPNFVNITPHLLSTSCSIFCQHLAPSLVNIAPHLSSILRPISCQHHAPSLINLMPISHQHHAPSFVHKPHLSSMSSPLLYGDSFFIGLTTHAKYHVSIFYTSVWAGFWENFIEFEKGGNI